MQTVDEIQTEIDVLNEELESLIQERNNLNWQDAPVICELNGFKWVLGPEAPEALNWVDAVAWCKSVGGELPSRVVLLLAYENENENLRSLFAAYFYWSSTEFSASAAWSQGFYNGTLYFNSKTYAAYVRAVRKLPI